MVGETMMGLAGGLDGVTDNASVNIVPHPTSGRALALTGECRREKDGWRAEGRGEEALAGPLLLVAAA